MDSTRNVDYRELIKESISDSSSESSESSSSSSSEDDSSSDSSESLVLEITAVDEAGDHRVQESAADTSFDGFLGPEPPEAVDIEDFPSPHKRTVRADSLVSNSSQQSSASLQVRHPTTIPDTSEPVPLRKRAYSDLQEKDSLRHQAQKNFIADKESPERWRSRLWPGKAIIAYARMILRCHPPSVTIGVPINSGSRVDTLRPYWTEGEFVRIGSNFDSVNTHNSAFFLLNAEESRAAVANGEESAADEDNKPTMDHRGNYSSGSSGSGNGWLDCEVVHIVAESELGTARPNDKDTRQGSVWVVKVAIRTPNIALDDSVLSPSRRQQKTAAKPPQAHRETFLSGGDLMVIASPYWDRPYLGIVQPWDPDYDVKFGINFQSNPQIQQHTLAEAIAQSENTGEIATINVLVCVDSLEQSSMSSHGDIPGGWVAPGSIYPGVCFHMSLLGNVMTYLRECQALMSVKLLNSRLQQAIINPEGRSKVSYVTDHHLHDDPGPTNVPFRLWDALRRSHNDSQLRALRMICKRHSEADVPASPICLLQGPPGTGKTKTILGVLSVCLSGALKPMSKATKVVPGSSFNSAEVKRLRSDSFSLNGDAGSFKAGRPRILVCAPSNTAVDELVFRILTQGLLGPDGLRIDDLSVVRIGHTMKDEYLQRVKSHVFVRKEKQSRYGLSEQENQILRVVERVTLDNIVDDRRRVIQATNSGHIKASELRRQVLERADIVAATLSGAGSQPILEVILRISGFKFDAVIIDEAAQAVEPSTLIPFKYNPGLIVMVGDPCQLPATVFSRVCKEHNYSQSLFLRLQRTGLPVAMLETQYRMHPLIAEFPSARYYNHSLLTDSSVATLMKNGKAFYNDSSCHFRPLVFFDLAYSSERNDNRSFSNPEEARFVVAHLQRLIQGYPGEGQNVGIIAPYRAQRKLIVQSLRQALGNELCAELDPEISTVDGFQGREKDIIIFSCVRASKGGDREGSGIGFLKEWQRLNVAVTRAKYALWIVGHQQTLQRDPEWRALLDFVRQRNVLFSLQKDQALPMRGDSSNSSAAPRDDSRARDDYHNRHRRRDDEQPRHHHHHHHHGRSAKNNHHHHKHRNKSHHSQKPPSNDPK